MRKLSIKVVKINGLDEYGERGGNGSGSDLSGDLDEELDRFSKLGATFFRPIKCRLVCVVHSDSIVELSELNDQTDQLVDVTLKRLHVLRQETLVLNSRQVVLMFYI